jgi:putative endopeptidase
MHLKIRKLFVIATAISIASCSNQNTSQQTFTDPLASHTDSSISPADNFFLFANNGWFKSNPIPASERSNGIFQTIQDTINNSIKLICERSSALTDAKPGSNEQKIGDFYFSGMDTTAINKAGVGALKTQLDLINTMTYQNIAQVTAQLAKLNAAGMFGFYVGVDDKNSALYSIMFMQGGLGLPDRDYYFNNDARTVSIRKAYIQHLKAQFLLLGYDDANATQASDDVMQIETDLAASSRTMADRRDPYLNYNKVSIAHFNKESIFNFEQFLAQVGLTNVDSVVVGQPEFFNALNKIIKKYDANKWQAYAKTQLLHAYASHLNAEFEQQHFSFFGTTLSGTKEMKPRWKRMVELTDESLGDLIGQIYVAQYLPAGTKEKLLEIGNNIRTVYADHIKNLSWMSEVTKQKALSKLNKIVMKVGYPDVWKDMSALTIKRNDFISNVLAANAWSFNYMIQHYGKPVDRSEWSMQPQTYNAYYNPSYNEIVVPACNIIVPGFEGRMPDDAILYGIIGGSTFGHEITHGFDDQGSLYDENGNLNNWWTTQDSIQFKARTKLIVQQYNNYIVLDSLHVNGDATQGENIADLGGLVMGYEAFKKTEQGKSTKIIGGYTPDQRFFLAYAYAWMVNRRPESLARQIMSDVHSPSEFRVNGPVSNMTQFYDAFKIKPGSPMHRADSLRIVIW